MGEMVDRTISEYAESGVERDPGRETRRVRVTRARARQGVFSGWGLGGEDKR